MLSLQQLHLLRVGVLATALSFAPWFCHAQASTRLQVAVFDSLHKLPLKGAVVSVMQGRAIAAEDTTDSGGEVSFSRLPDGVYSVTIFHPVLELLDLGLKSDSVVIKGDNPTRLSLAVPGPTALAKKMCGATTDGSVVIGSVSFGSGALEDAEIVVEWMPQPPAGDSTGLTVPTSLRTKSSADGRFRMCGLPSGVTAMLMISHGEHTRAGGFVVAQDQPIVSVGAQLSKTTSDRFLSFGDIGSTSQQSKSERSTIKGFVLTGSSLPVANATIAHGTATTVSDSRGAFQVSATTTWPSVLTLRRAGFEGTEVHLFAAPSSQSGSSNVIVLLHDNTPRLSTVNVAAAVRAETAVDTALRNIGFLTRQKYNPGEFITAETIEKLRPIHFSDLFRMSTTVHVQRDWIESIRHSTSGAPLCLRLFIDDVLRSDAGSFLLDALVYQIGAIEVYRGAYVPEQYARTEGGDRCTIVLVWTKTRLNIQ